MASSTAMPPPLRAGASNRFLRVFMNHLATVAAVGSTILVMAPLIAIFCLSPLQGRQFAQSRLLYPDTETRGRDRRRDGQFHRWIGRPAGDRQPHGRAHRHCRRHLHRGVWPRQAFGQHGPLHRRCAQRRAFDRHGHRRLHADCGAAESISPRLPAESRWAS